MTGKRDTTNRFFALAQELVWHTDQSIFLTGKAGTGKTTFLKYLREQCPKNNVITAPTGVAAINAGGVTLHSFFQLPLAPFVPLNRSEGGNRHSPQTESVNRHSLLSRLRFNRDKKKLLQELELLIVDEISMVRADILDAVDTVLRHVRHRPQQPFGGVQVLMIGDLYQLPPVLREPDRILLADYYPGPYFFDSQVMRDHPPLVVEFEKIYRQTDPQFIRLLNQVRNNELDEEGRALLESRVQPGYGRRKDENAILLCTHNEQARRINQEKLEDLPHPALRYEAQIRDEFPENAYPADAGLVLKKEARVMFIRNDSAENGRRFYNGKLGLVSRLEEDRVFVRCDGEEDELEVKRETWENIRYSLDSATRTLKEDVLGSFSQFPLRLAWAITIHKSQGLTFEEVIIDAGEAFAPGQVYVALSRCTKLEGLILRSRIRGGSLGADPRITQFSEQARQQPPLEEALKKERAAYEQKILGEQFDLRRPLETVRELQQELQEEPTRFPQDAIDWVSQLQQNLMILKDTADKFQRWWQGLLEPFQPPGENPELVARTQKAALHFRESLQAMLDALSACPLVTEHKQTAKSVGGYLQELSESLARQSHILEGYESGWMNTETWQQRRKSPLQAAIPVRVYAAEKEQFTKSEHPALYQQLKKCRDALSARRQLPVYLVAGHQTLEEMTRFLPQTKDDLLRIKGMGPARVEKFGEEFLSIIRAYTAEHGLTIPDIPGEEIKDRRRSKKERPATGGTYAETLALHRQGLTVEEIARNRQLVPGTIEAHLARLIEINELRVQDFVAPATVALIKNALQGYHGGPITPVKQALGPDISFGQIRMVMASMGLKPDTNKNKNEDSGINE